MGVKGLWKLLSDYGRDVNLKDKKLAVDASIWICQLSFVPSYFIAYAITKRILKLLYNGVIPIFVFDGAATQLKNNALRQRRERALRASIKDTLGEQRCETCANVASKCQHNYTITQKFIDEMNAKAIKRIKEHNYNWGEFSESEDRNSSTESADMCMAGPEPTSIPARDCYAQSNNAPARPDRSAQRKPTNPIAHISRKMFKNMSRDQKLAKLVEIRSLRGLPMPLDTSSPEALCLSQIKNVKKRNMVRLMIDEINNTALKRVQNDWRYRIEYKNAATTSKGLENSESESSSTETPIAQHDQTRSTITQELNTMNDANRSAGVVDRDMLYKMYGHLVKNQASVEQLDSDASYQWSKWESIRIKRNNVGTSEQTLKDAEKSFEPSLSQDDNVYGALVSKTNSGSTGKSMKYIKSDTADAAELDEYQFINNMCQNERYNGDIKATVIKVLEIFEICYIQSPEEADSQCAYLYEQGIVDGVVTEDNDLILHGAPVYRNFFKKNKPVLAYFPDEIQTSLGMSKQDLIKLSFLLGSDYTPGINGFGIRKSMLCYNDIPNGDIADLVEIYEHRRAHKLDTFKNGCVNPSKLKQFLREQGLPLSEASEIYQYAQKLI